MDGDYLRYVFSFFERLINDFYRKRSESQFFSFYGENSFRIPKFSAPAHLTRASSHGGLAASVHLESVLRQTHLVRDEFESNLT